VTRADRAVLVLAVAEAAWMAFDGGRALVAGDYVTVGGELGPWADVVSAVGVDPRSTATKTFFLVYGAAWLGVAAAFARGVAWARRGMTVAAACSLWYLVFGTVASAVQLLLLRRAAARRSA
jgi:hypothetical protein